MQTWFILLPPLIVLLSAFIFQRLNLSLALGILSGALIASHGNIQASALLALKRLLAQITDPDYLYLYGFLLLIGTFIVLISKAGGAYAFGKAITHHLRSKRSVETSSLILSTGLFLDDYLSTLTVGYIMRPLTDAWHIPRAKLAYLVHSLSGPLVIMAPVSSWVAMLTSQIESSGISTTDPFARIVADPYFTFLNTIPYIFYSLLTVITAWVIVRYRISYGPMGTQEKIARETHNLFGGKTPLIQKFHPEEHPHATYWDLILPLGFLVLLVFSSILWVGDFSLFGGHNSLLMALKNNTNTFFALCLASAITVIGTFIFAIMRKTIQTSDISAIIRQGVSLMQGAIIMVILASTLGALLKLDLQIGTVVAQSLGTVLVPWTLPALFFIISTIISTMTGSSWGTIAIMLPSTMQLLSSLNSFNLNGSPQDSAILLAILGAIFSGSVCGDHISPLSETTIMASTSSGAYPLDHAITQLFYAIPVIIGTLVGFITIGVTYSRMSPMVSYGISAMIGLVVNLLIVFLLNYRYKEKKGIL